MRLIDADVLMNDLKKAIDESHNERRAFIDYNFVALIDDAESIVLTADELDKHTTLEVLRKVKEQCVNGEGCTKCWYDQFCTLLPEEWEF